MIAISGLIFMILFVLYFCMRVKKSVWDVDRNKVLPEKTVKAKEVDKETNIEVSANTISEWNIDPGQAWEVKKEPSPNEITDRQQEEEETPSGWNVNMYQMYLQKVKKGSPGYYGHFDAENTTVQTEINRISKTIEKGRNKAVLNSQADFSFAE